MMGSIGEAQSYLKQNTPEPEALQLIPEAMARKYCAIPLTAKNNVLRVAMANPTDILALEALASWSQMRIAPEAATNEEVIEAVDFNYKAYDEIEKKISSISISGIDKTNDKLHVDTATEAPVAQALTLIIDEAVKARASDVHLQPSEDTMRVRFRIDGALHDIFTLPSASVTPLISRI